MKTDVQMSFRTTESFKKKLEAIAQEQRRSTASLVKIILEDYVEAYEKEKEHASERE